MKPFKYLVITLFFVTLSTGAFAQLRLGGGLGFGFNQEAFSLFARAGYDFAEQFRTNVTFQYYMIPNEDTEFIDRDASALNIHLNYDFANLPTIDLYGLAGLSIFTFNTESIAAGKIKNTDLGLDIGVGGLLGVADKIDILTEFKYNVGGADELHFNFGLMFNITGSR